LVQGIIGKAGNEMTIKKPTLSVAIITLNEERNIVRTLKSLAFKGGVFAKVEVLVVDAGSQDNTMVLARKLGAKVLTRAWKGYSDQKNWAFSRCAGDWVLSLDADEVLTPALVAEIERTLPAASAEVVGYAVKRRAFFLGKWIRHCGWWPDEQLRLFRKGKGRFNAQPVHEALEVTGKTKTLQEPLDHFTYDSIGAYLQKMDHYSDLAVGALGPDDRKVASWRSNLFLRPPLTFLKMYVLKMGFLDGWHGFVLCSLSAFHDLAKYAKLWEKWVLRNGKTDP
jgi:glycosyltransferase involved in cell wall biosynthesis